MIDPSPILALAPMAGITDWPMRLLCAEQGCNYTTTEMVSAMGYLTAPDSLYVYQYLLAVHPDEPAPGGAAVWTPSRSDGAGRAKAERAGALFRHRYQHGLSRPQGDGLRLGQRADA